MSDSGGRDPRRIAILLRLPAAVGGGIASAFLAMGAMWMGAALFVQGEQMWLIPVVVVAPWAQVVVGTLGSLAAYAIAPSRRNIALLGVASVVATTASFSLGTVLITTDWVAWQGAAFVGAGAIVGALVPVLIASMGSRESFPFG